MIFYPIDDQAASVRRFEAKEMDLAYNFSADQLDSPARKSYGEQVHVSPTLATYYYAFDTRQEPYRRRARAPGAVDGRRPRLPRPRKSTRARSCRPTPWCRPGMASYGDPAKADFAKMSQLDREDKAVELMKEAGYGEGGKPLEHRDPLQHQPEPRACRHRRRRHVEEHLRRQGVAGEPRRLRRTTPTCRKAASSTSPAPAGSADYADAENFLALSLCSNKTFNYGHFENAEFDALMKKSYEERRSGGPLEDPA